MAELDSQSQALIDIVTTAKKAIADAKKNTELETVRIEYLGKKKKSLLILNS
jgi:hypothetical protein